VFSKVDRLTNETQLMWCNFLNGPNLNLFFLGENKEVLYNPSDVASIDDGWSEDKAGNWS
jgi:hypothetical protein